ncbi:MAG: hypothetical protein WC736_09720 [Gallionella sp.]|jgi:hypothetical protein
MYFHSHLLKFFPLAFWVVWDKDADFTGGVINLPRIDTDATSELDFTARLLVDFYQPPPPDFPEAPTDEKLWLLVDHLALQAEPNAGHGFSAATI